MKKIFLLITLLFIFNACINTDYVGKSFEPTTEVDIYFSENDVDRNYEVMGKITEEATEFTTFDKLQQKMIEQAKVKGADGLIIGGMEKVDAGTSSYTSGEEDKDITKNKFTSSTSNVIIKDNVLHGTLIKYKE